MAWSDPNTSFHSSEPRIHASGPRRASFVSRTVAAVLGTWTGMVRQRGRATVATGRSSPRLLRIVSRTSNTAKWKCPAPSFASTENVGQSRPVIAIGPPTHSQPRSTTQRRSTHVVMSLGVLGDRSIRTASFRPPAKNHHPPQWAGGWVLLNASRFGLPCTNFGSEGASVASPSSAGARNTYRSPSLVTTHSSSCTAETDTKGSFPRDFCQRCFTRSAS